MPLGDKLLSKFGALIIVSCYVSRFHCSSMVFLFQKATQIRSTPFTEESDESSDDDAVTTNDENEAGTDAIVPNSPTRSRSKDVHRKQQLNQSSSGAMKRGRHNQSSSGAIKRGSHNNYLILSHCLFVALHSRHQLWTCRDGQPNGKLD